MEERNERREVLIFRFSSSFLSLYRRVFGCERVERVIAVGVGMGWNR